MLITGQVTVVFDSIEQFLQALNDCVVSSAVTVEESIEDELSLTVAIDADTNAVIPAE